jgi:hypothetical protein
VGVQPDISETAHDFDRSQQLSNLSREDCRFNENHGERHVASDINDARLGLQGNRVRCDQIEAMA